MPCMQPLIEGRTEAEWCREACRIGAYDCVGPDGKHIRTFTGERTTEKVIATIQGLKAQAERYDRAVQMEQLVAIPAAAAACIHGYEHHDWRAEGPLFVCKRCNATYGVLELGHQTFSCETPMGGKTLP